MSTVLVERSFAQPVAFEDISAIGDRGAWCIEAHGARFLKAYFSRDHRRMLCLYEAPDAESVRLSQGKIGMPFERVWSARPLRHAGSAPGRDAVVVERLFSPPMDEAAVRDALARGSRCLEERGCRILWTYLSTDGRRCVCVFAAPDAESVRETQRQIGMPFETAWPATVHGPSSAS